VQRSTLGSGRQKSRSDEAEDRFRGLAEASFSTPLGRLAFLVEINARLEKLTAWQSGCNAMHTAACLAMEYTAWPASNATNFSLLDGKQLVGSTASAARDIADT